MSGLKAMNPVGEPSANPCERLIAELTLLVRGSPVTEGMKCGTQPADIRLPTVDEHCLRAGHSTHVLRGLTASFISGSAIAARMFDLKWIERLSGTRVVRVTDRGFIGLEREFGVKLGKSR
jgi:hypothetical protein